MHKIVNSIILFLVFGYSQSQELNSIQAEPVQATIEQIAKKWHVVNYKTDANLTESLKKRIKKILKSKFIFNKKGFFSDGTFVEEDIGEWKFTNNNKSIIIIQNDLKITWDIMKITEEELILKREANNITIFFSTNRNKKS